MFPTMEGTELWLPPDLQYPITISSLAVQRSSSVVRGTHLLTFSFIHKSTNGVSETRFGTWDSTTDGTLQSWKVKQGDIISQPQAVVIINEPCKHPVQIGGLCAVCGKDMTESDYTGFSNASRANIQMTHSGKGPTVSLEEAERIERETAVHLLKQRKLSLIVDLDQTIVHATVDPTVGEWIAEGEAWEARHSTEVSSCAADEDDPVNPNWDALKDVAKFMLGPEPTFQPHCNGIPKNSVPGCMYYIKPRPGLRDFLTKMIEKYDMHVYTMGTRAYAEAVCAAIDPDGIFFGDRILSRDESGSLTQKSVQRLFPCDQSMVVIIDDRADVWEWSPNLLKVRQYDFFVGIGDINSTLLPKASPLLLSSSSTPTHGPEESDVELSAKEVAATLVSRNKITSERIAAQVEERPLARQQELLEEEVENEVTETATNGAKNEGGGVNEKHNQHRKALLKNDDTELIRVAALLEDVHKRFYDAFDTRLFDSEPKTRKVNFVDGRPSHEVPFDVRTIIPRIRTETLAGTHIVFSSVIPLNVEPSTSEFWRTAEVFGATCHTSLTPQVTHVVAAKRGTAKVDAARKRGNIYVVWLAWFVDSLALWKRQAETPYLIEPDDTIQPSHIPPQIHVTPAVDEEELLEDPSVDVDFDADVWADANAEVDEVLGEETEDDELGSNFPEDGDGGDDSGWRSDASNISSLSGIRRGKKRSRDSSVSLSTTVNEGVSSPQLKRKKLAETRRGPSHLKVGRIVDDGATSGEASREGSLKDGEDETADFDDPEDKSRDNESTTSTDGNTVDDVFNDDDDFLARELGEEEDGG